MALQWLDEEVPFQNSNQIFGGGQIMISDVTHTLGQVPNQNFMLKKSSINLLLLLRAKPTKVVAHVCPISQLSDLNMTFSLVSSTCLSRKKRRRNKHILLTYQCS
jgi:hypothetical protein